MFNINKVRRIVKAQFGLSIPSGNPYMTTNGLAIPGNGITQQMGTDYAAEFRNRAEQIMIPTNNLIDFNAKMGDLFSLKLQNIRDIPRVRTQGNTNGITTPISTSPPINTPLSLQQLFQKLGGWNTVGQVVDFADSLLFGGQRVYNSPVANGFRQGYDFISNNVSPQLSLWMKGAKFVGNGLSSLGLKSDNNIFNGIPIVENITSIGAKKSHNLVINKDAIEKGGGSYTGTITNANKIQPKAGKSFSIFNSGSRRHTNRTVDALNDQFVDMGRVMDKATDMTSMATNMSDLNHMQYGFNLNGGYDQRYMRAAKFGTKLKRVKRINFRKQGGEIVGAINLDNWQPVITEAIEQFENGGWTPVITFQNGGEIQNKSRSLQELIEYSKKVNPRFIQRLSEPIKYVEWVDDNGEKQFGTHELGYAEVGGKYVIFPNIQERDDKQLFRYTDFRQALDNALKNKNVLWVNSEDEAKLFTESKELENGEFSGYKSGWPEFFKQKPQFKKGGKTEELSKYDIEETNQKNIIPEGALHAHKHHMENADNLTKKGIPVVDNDGEQQAEIERNEIIFTLEVTKALEDLYSKYFNENSTQKDKDEAAIEAGKLLVYEILYNTDDRTNLISKCKEGGVLNDIK